MTPVLYGAVLLAALLLMMYLGWIVGRQDIRVAASRARREGFSDACLKLSRNPAPALDPEALRTTAAAIRSARVDWLKFQLHGHDSSYQGALRQLIAVGISAGRRYLKGERDGVSIAVPLADALNVCVRMAEVADEHLEQQRLQQKHLGNYEGKPS